MKAGLRRIAAVFISVCILGITGCSGNSNVTSEEWAYIHEPGVTVLELKSDGKAVYHNVDYSYTLEDGWLTLKDKAGNEQKLRFTPHDEDGMFIYEPAVYELREDFELNGVIGYWQQIDGNKTLSFEFTDKGTFREDYYSPGYYFTDEENGIIKLVYNDMYPDTYIYYQLDGNTLTVDYPWPVVHTEK